MTKQMSKEILGEGCGQNSPVGSPVHDRATWIQTFSLYLRMLIPKVWESHWQYWQLQATYRVNWGKVTNRNDTATTKQAHVNVMQQDSLTFANRKTGKSDHFKLVMFASHASARLPLAVMWHAMRPMCKSHIGNFRNTNGWWSHTQIGLSKNIRKNGESNIECTQSLGLVLPFHWNQLPWVLKC